MKFAKIILTFSLFSILCVWPASAQPVEQSLARLFSYDPHPATAIFPDKAPFKGQTADIEIKFNETWVEKKDSANISAIAFTVSAIKGSAVLGSAETAKFQLNPGLNKGQIIGEANLGNIFFKATLDSLEKNKDGVTDLTVVFSIAYNNEDLSQAQKAEADQSGASSLDLSLQLEKKADAIPDKNKKVKTGLYQKALLAAPEASTSPMAAEFRARIENKINSLGGQITAAETPVAPKLQEPVKAETNDKIADTKPPVSPTATVVAVKPASTPEQSKVNPQATALFQQAKSQLAQGKGPEGREALRKALEIAPDFHDALVLLGDNAFENRKFARAKEAFDKALNQNERNSDVMLKYFKACYYLGEGSAAVERISAAKSRNPQDTRITQTLAEACFQLGDLPNARIYCEEVLQKSPADTKANDLLKRIDRLMK